MTQHCKTVGDEPDNSPQAQHQCLSALRHELSNNLYSIWLQARCARLGLEDDRLDRVRKSLQQIEAAVEDTQSAADRIIDLTRAKD